MMMKNMMTSQLPLRQAIFSVNPNEFKSHKRISNIFASIAEDKMRKMHSVLANYRTICDII